MSAYESWALDYTTLSKLIRSLDEIGIDFTDTTRISRENNSIIHTSDLLWVPAFLGPELDNSVHRLFECFIVPLSYSYCLHYLGYSNLSILLISVFLQSFYCYHFSVNEQLYFSFLSSFGCGCNKTTYARCSNVLNKSLWYVECF